LAKWPWRRDKKISGIEAVELPRGGIALSVEGTKVAAIPLPRNTAREIAGQLAATEAKAGGRYVSESESVWLVVTHSENPTLVRDYDKFVHIAADGIAHATGSQVPPSTVAVSTFLKVSLKDQLHDSVEVKLIKASEKATEKEGNP
jgi:hypothetical protein